MDAHSHEACTFRVGDRADSRRMSTVCPHSKGETRHRAKHCAPAGRRFRAAEVYRERGRGPGALGREIEQPDGVRLECHRMGAMEEPWRVSSVFCGLWPDRKRL